MEDLATCPVEPLCKEKIGCLVTRCAVKKRRKKKQKKHGTPNQIQSSELLCSKNSQHMSPPPFILTSHVYLTDSPILDRRLSAMPLGKPLGAVHFWFSLCELEPPLPGFAKHTSSDWEHTRLQHNTSIDLKLTVMSNVRKHVHHSFGVLFEPSLWTCYDYSVL